MEESWDPMDPAASSNLGKFLLQSVREIVGPEQSILLLERINPNGLKNSHSLSIKKDSLPFHSLSRLIALLEDSYGKQAGRGMALQIGRAFFTAVLKVHGPSLGFFEPSFRLFPISKKVLTGLKAIAEFLSKNSDQNIQVEQSQDHLLWVIQSCLCCRERTSGEPACHFVMGFLQESLSWFSGGKTYILKEITCIAMGDLDCGIQVDLTPI